LPPVTFLGERIKAVRDVGVLLALGLLWMGGAANANAVKDSDVSTVRTLFERAGSLEVDVRKSGESLTN
jgi:hypothetical protein